MASSATTDEMYCTAHEMALRSRTVIELLTFLCWTMLRYTPPKLKNPYFDQAFPFAEVIEAALLPIVFADGLMGVFQSTTPPPLSFFKGLPPGSTSQWGVYVIVLEKDNCRPKVYIGSGTSQTGGVHRRLWHYRKGQLMPFYVKQALDDGFSIMHGGLLCWSPIPDPTRVATVRGLFLLLEAAFTLWFWPIVSRDQNYGMPYLCPWDTNTFEYDGCCNHFSLVEGAAGLAKNLSPEQARAVKAERRRKARAWFHTQTRAYRRARDRGPNRRRRMEILASKKYSCTVCGLAFETPGRQRKHNATQAHLNKAAGVKKVITRQAISEAQNRATKRYYCQPCNYAAGNWSSLKGHYDSKGHLKKAGNTVLLPTVRPKGKTTAQRAADRKVTAKDNVETKKFYCQPCDHATTDQAMLNRHLRTQRHKDKVAGIVRVPKDPRSTKRREQRNAAQIAKLYYCEVCDHAAGTQRNLDNHFRSKSHQNKVAKPSQQLD